MNENTKQIINNQLKIALSEIEAMNASGQRTELRLRLAEVLLQVADIQMVEDTNCGKDNIKQDKAKKNNKSKKSKELEEVVVEEAKTEIQEQIETVVENIEKEMPEQVIQEEQVSELDGEEVSLVSDAVIFLNEDNVEVDCTEAWNLLQENTEEELKGSLALQITEYNIVEEYKTLSELSSIEDSQSKLVLAYYIAESGLDTINAWVEQFTDSMIKDLYEFINNENIDGFTDWLQQ